MQKISENIAKDFSVQPQIDEGRSGPPSFPEPPKRKRLLKPKPEKMPRGKRGGNLQPRKLSTLARCGP